MLIKNQKKKTLTQDVPGLAVRKNKDVRNKQQTVSTCMHHGMDTQTITRMYSNLMRPSDSMHWISINQNSATDKKQQQ